MGTVQSLMELLTSTEMLAPLFLVILLLLLSTIAIYLGKTKLALLINYLFTFTWGYIFFREN